ncbi:Two-component sensor histidine kinase, contains HisKA and HATPase domains [Devosia enhydra]|uniref:Blue-light-activated histidine kinase n=1 Tax=Devosia enhydra TaxID=665118 RepID=A0A1K2HWD6_9HYPH|nr:HWE histidine kinase domain-containing protein [Devosia enhydra]SFZ83250.1 Two-component sensor histidine kinase, contains HisKA and HATPase domains [Devosia enhydra]
MPERPAALSPDVWNSVISPDRLAALSALSILDSPDDPDFDRLSRLAASVFAAPVGLVTLIDTERQWFKSCYGTDVRETPTGISFCAHTIASEATHMIVPDMLADPRFVDNPLVTGEHRIRFYVGAPIIVRGEKLGTLCVLDRVPRNDIQPGQIEQLRSLADTVAALFALKDESRVRAQTAAELIREEWRHALTLEAGKVGSWIWDVRTGVVTANDILRRLFGLDPHAEIRIEQIFAAIEDVTRGQVEAAVEASFRDGVDYHSEFRLQSGRWLMGRGRVYQRDAAGAPEIMMGVNVDITEAHDGADRTRVLLRELNHRVKNTLAMIQSLARQTLRQNSDPQRFIEAFSGRLRALSDAHALLADRDWSGLRLLEVVTSQVLAHDRDGRQVSIEGEDVHLPPDHALGLGLILNELTSNARRFGALSVASGRVTLRWARDAQGLLVLDWKERGGPMVGDPDHRGLGTRLIERSLDKVIGSAVTLGFPSDGVEARIALPLDPV